MNWTRIIPAALISLALIVCSLLIGGRYVVTRGPSDLMVRYDRLTGAVWYCGVTTPSNVGLGCAPMEEWGGVPAATAGTRKVAAPASAGSPN
jgi:hypothetical protein